MKWYIYETLNEKWYTESREVIDNEKDFKKDLYFDISCFLLDVDVILSIHSLWYIDFYITA